MPMITEFPGSPPVLMSPVRLKVLVQSAQLTLTMSLADVPCDLFSPREVKPQLVASLLPFLGPRWLSRPSELGLPSWMETTSPSW